MNKLSALMAFLLSALLAEGSVSVSNLESVPAENVIISQLKTDGVILQSRHTKPTDWKGIGQSFKWNTEDALDGIGLFISTEQAAASPPYSKDMQHVLIIQELEGYRGVPGKTVYQVEFTLKAENIKPGQWLYLDIQDLILKNRQYYGITLVPAESALSSQRIYWATTEDASSYAGGDANQMDIPGRGMPPGNGIVFGSANKDAAFYLQSTSQLKNHGSEMVIGSNGLKLKEQEGGQVDAGRQENAKVTGAGVGRTSLTIKKGKS